MFTGITQGTAELSAVTPADGFRTLVLRLPPPLLTDLRIGASVCVDGVCLTVVSVEGEAVSFDVSDGTLRLTNLGDRRPGERVNVERSARSGDENGGHVLSGHVSGTAPITAINTGSGPLFLEVEIPEPHRRYVFLRGYLALNGASLTVADIDAGLGRYRINLIPETIRQTGFAAYKVGQRVNYEVELQTQIMVDTIERCIQQSLAGLGLRAEPPPVSG